jgi:hypothetical protein
MLSPRDASVNPFHRKSGTGIQPVNTRADCAIHNHLVLADTGRPLSASTYEKLRLIDRLIPEASLIRLRSAVGESE